MQATKQEARRIYARVAGSGHVACWTAERRHACFHVGMFLDICVGASAVQKGPWKSLTTGTNPQRQESRETGLCCREYRDKSRGVAA